MNLYCLIQSPPGGYNNNPTNVRGMCFAQNSEDALNYFIEEYKLRWYKSPSDGWEYLIDSDFEVEVVPETNIPHIGLFYAVSQVAVVRPKELGVLE